MYDLVFVLGELAEDVLELLLAHVDHRVLAPTLTPKDRALGVERGVRGAVVEELRVGVVHRDDDREVLLDTLDKEFEKSTTFILVTHVFLELREEGLQFFGGIETWDFSGRDK